MLERIGPMQEEAKHLEDERRAAGVDSMAGGSMAGGSPPVWPGVFGPGGVSAVPMGVSVPSGVVSAMPGTSRGGRLAPVPRSRSAARPGRPLSLGRPRPTRGSRRALRDTPRRPFPGRVPGWEARQSLSFYGTGRGDLISACEPRDHIQDSLQLYGRR